MDFESTNAEIIPPKKLTSPAAIKTGIWSTTCQAEYSVVRKTKSEQKAKAKWSRHSSSFSAVMFFFAIVFLLKNYIIFPFILFLVSKFWPRFRQAFLAQGRKKWPWCFQLASVRLGTSHAPSEISMENWRLVQCCNKEIYHNSNSHYCNTFFLPQEPLANPSMSQTWRNSLMTHTTQEPFTKKSHPKKVSKEPVNC